MTLPEYVPEAFKKALQDFAEDIRQNFSSSIPAQPEDQLKPPVKQLLAAAAAHVDSRFEAQVEGLGARPDLGVSVSALLCGYVELKAPGKGARPTRFRGADKKQWEKFKALPNLIYTDGREWALYRSGELQNECLRFSGNLITAGAGAFDDDEITELHTLLRDFLSWQPIAPSSAGACQRL